MDTYLKTVVAKPLEQILVAKWVAIVLINIIYTFY